MKDNFMQLVTPINDNNNHHNNNNYDNHHHNNNNNNNNNNNGKGGTEIDRKGWELNEFEWKGEVLYCGAKSGQWRFNIEKFTREDEKISFGLKKFGEMEEKIKIWLSLHHPHLISPLYYYYDDSHSLMLITDPLSSFIPLQSMKEISLSLFLHISFALSSLLCYFHSSDLIFNTIDISSIFVHSVDHSLIKFAPPLFLFVCFFPLFLFSISISLIKFISSFYNNNINFY